MEFVSDAIELWLSVRWCVAVPRCKGAKIGDVGSTQQQIGVKSAKEVVDEGNKEQKLECWRERRQHGVGNPA